MFGVGSCGVLTEVWARSSWGAERGALLACGGADGAGVSERGAVVGRWRILLCGPVSFYPLSSSRLVSVIVIPEHMRSLRSRRMGFGLPVARWR